MTEMIYCPANFMHSYTHTHSHTHIHTLTAPGCKESCQPEFIIQLSICHLISFKKRKSLTKIFWVVVAFFFLAYMMQMILFQQAPFEVFFFCFLFIFFMFFGF